MNAQLPQSGGPMGGMMKSGLFQSLFYGDPYGMYGTPNNGLMGPILSPMMKSFAQNATKPAPTPPKPGGFTIHGIDNSTGSNPDYRALAQNYADQYGVPSDLFARQINQESGFNPSAVSPAGAIGIAQFEPGTAQTLGIDPANPDQALRGAAALMRSYYDTYGSWALALVAYNAGPGVADAVAQGNTNSLPAETQRYLSDVLGSYQ
jgi:soluble lytic murein transglycosylase-like protein